MAESVAFSEYKIVQDKIGKIGAFRFTVRGWCVTLVTGYVGATALAAITPYANIASLIPILLFSAVEDRQDRIQNALTVRAFALEKEVARIEAAAAAAAAPPAMKVPRIAFSLAQGIKPSGWQKKFFPFIERHFYLMLSIAVVIATLGRPLTEYLHPSPGQVAKTCC